jgi:dihydropyrimidinase
MSDQKILGKDRFTKIPNGGPGIENRMQVLFHHGVNAGKLTLERFVDVTATAPAKIFGMYPKKGVIAVGSDADIVLWDPNAEFAILAATQTMATDYSMFEGWKVRGVPVKVYSRGDLVAENVKYVGTVGRGKFLKRKTLPEDVMKGHTLEGVAVTA